MGQVKAAAAGTSRFHARSRVPHRRHVVRPSPRRVRRRGWHRCIHHRRSTARHDPDADRTTVHRTNSATARKRAHGRGLPGVSGGQSVERRRLGIARRCEFRRISREHECVDDVLASGFRQQSGVRHPVHVGRRGPAAGADDVRLRERERSRPISHPAGRAGRRRSRRDRRPARPGRRFSRVQAL